MVKQKKSQHIQFNETFSKKFELYKDQIKEKDKQLEQLVALCNKIKYGPQSKREELLNALQKLGVIKKDDK